jgi:chitodextrinase
MTDRILRRKPLTATVLGLLTVLTVLAVSGSPARADTPLSTPGTPVAGTVTTTSISLSWTPSTGPVANYTVEVTPIYASVPQPTYTTTTNQFTETGLDPDTTYEYRVWANPVAGSGYTLSAPSGYLIVRTLPVPDSSPPTAPTNLRSYSVSTNFATINMDPATDNHRVAGYVLQRQINGVWTDIGTNDITTVYMRDLTPSTTYTVVAVAFDANGNRSPRSAPLTFTTRALEPLPTCRVSIINYGQQNLVDITMEDMTAATVVDNWSLTFTLPAGQTVWPFNMTISRSGDLATGSPFSWDNRIGPGGALTVGFSGSRPAGSPLPSGFVLHATGLNPITCTS